MLKNKLESGQRVSAWLASERPREKFLQQGAEALSDAELLAIFLRTGVRGKNVLQLAQELLRIFGDLRGLLNADFRAFSQVKGLGQAKYVQLHAAKELIQRYLRIEIGRHDTLDSPTATKNFLAQRLRDKRSEVFAVLFLDNQNQVISYQELFQGSLQKTHVHPREIVHQCLLHNAAAVIFAHNHPSGHSEPSQADIELTQALKSLLVKLEIQVHDHLIVGNQIQSLAELGLL